MLKVLILLGALAFWLEAATVSGRAGEATGEAASSQQTVAPPNELLALEGDAEYGAYLASECSTCHQPGGHENGIPSLVGLPREEFISRIYAYKVKSRNNVTMQEIAAGLSFEEIAALATHFDGAKPK